MDANQIDWICESANTLSEWLISNGTTYYWNSETFSSPSIYGWSVSSIVYESSFEEHWDESWFFKGIQAFGLLALCEKGIISDILLKHGKYTIVLGNHEYNLHYFLNGETLIIRHDEEYADLDWGPVGTMATILSEYLEYP